MSGTHQQSDARASGVYDGLGRSSYSRIENQKDWDVPNRTKVVRLIVVPKGMALNGKSAIGDFARQHHATRVDVFIVYNTAAKEWQPYSWLGKQGLVSHDKAHQMHPETVVILMVADREQLQWECSVPFRIRNIRRAKPIPTFVENKESPAMPFRADLIGAHGGPGRPVVSGLPTLTEEQCDQLYKASFELWIPGEPKLTTIDPDIYCDWN